MFLSMIPLISE